MDKLELHAFTFVPTLMFKKASPG
jgi:hypothetical protein